MLIATTELMAERGYGALTVAAVAIRAGVSKATIYRRWPNKAAIAMDSFLALTFPRMLDPDTGSSLNDLQLQLTSVVRAFRRPEIGGTIAAFIALGHTDPRLAQEFRDRFLETRRPAAMRLLLRGVQRGELRADLDYEVAVDALYGPVYYRLLVGHQPLNQDFADKLVDHVYRGLATRPTSS